MTSFRSEPNVPYNSHYSSNNSKHLKIPARCTNAYESFKNLGAQGNTAVKSIDQGWG